MVRKNNQNKLNNFLKIFFTTILTIAVTFIAFVTINN